jgi:hypothetical protein
VKALRLEVIPQAQVMVVAVEALAVEDLVVLQVAEVDDSH